MKYSLMTEPHMGGTYGQQLEAAKWAEASGLVSFARCDHYLSDRDPVPDATDAFAVLAGLSRETSSLRLCVLVSPITFRHPAVIAKNAATIDQMSDGRFDLGVGTGWMDHEHEAFGIPFPDSWERWDRFEEALGYLQAAFGEGHSSYSGEYYSLGAEVKPKPTGLRLVLGGSGAQRTPTLAGTVADEYNFFTCPPDEAKAKIEVMRKAAGDRRVEATVMGPILVGRDESEYQERLAAFASARDTTPDDLEQRWTNAGLVVGAGDRVAEKIAALEEAGVERMYVQWIDLNDLDGMKQSFEVLIG
jgi:alkanesulfonate monooxygenase SsuD/methylene tetrahydromethanopterin reductase-like flavin-dependent oxidoreductase (luciferase family)